MSNPSHPAPGSRPDPNNQRLPRLVVVAHGFHPQVGGMERHALVTAKCLGDRVRVVVLAPQITRASSLATEVGPLPDNFSVRRLKALRLGGELVIRPDLLLRELAKLDPDLVWTHQPGGSADLAGLYCLATRTNWVATYHADPHRGTVQRAPIITVEGRLLRYAAHVFVTSSQYAATLISRGLNKSRVSVVPTGPLLGDGSPPVVNVPSPTDWERPGPQHPLLFVGQLDSNHRYKRPERLVQAIGRLWRGGLSVNLSIVGGGELLNDLRSLAVSEGVGNLIDFTGPVDDARLAKLYASAWALVLPSDSDTEGFGAVCIEAVHYGCPVVGYPIVPGVALLADLGCALLVSPADEMGLEESLRRVWISLPLRDSLANAARSASPQFDWPLLAKRFLEPLAPLLLSSPMETQPGPVVANDT